MNCKWFWMVWYVYEWIITDVNRTTQQYVSLVHFYCSSKIEPSNRHSPYYAHLIWPYHCFIFVLTIAHMALDSLTIIMYRALHFIWHISSYFFVVSPNFTIRCKLQSRFKKLGLHLLFVCLPLTRLQKYTCLVSCQFDKMCIQIYKLNNAHI